MRDHEQRFCVHVSDLPDNIRAISADRTRRSCILDKQTGDSRLECVFDQSARRTLVFCTDMGAIGWYKHYFLFAKVRIRGCFFFHLPHPRHDNFLNKMSRTEMRK